MKNQKLIISTIAALTALNVGTAQAGVPEAPKSWEKCTGISKAGMNDCGSTDGAHGCSGKAKSDSLMTEWIYVPEGTCEKITGGKVIAVKKAKG